METIREVSLANGSPVVVCACVARDARLRVETSKQQRARAVSTVIILACQASVSRDLIVSPEIGAAGC